MTVRQVCTGIIIAISATLLIYGGLYAVFLFRGVPDPMTGETISVWDATIDPGPDFQYQDSYFVVAHFNWSLGGMAFCMAVFFTLYATVAMLRNRRKRFKGSGAHE